MCTMFGGVVGMPTDSFDCALAVPAAPTSAAAAAAAAARDQTMLRLDAMNAS
jgi:hypothetical protein